MTDELKRAGLPRPARPLKEPERLDSALDVLGRLEAVVAQLGQLGVVVTAGSLPPPPQSLPASEETAEPAEPASRPSLPARAGKQGSRLVRWIGVVISVLTLVAQGISMLSRPENGPLVQTFLVIAAGLRGHPAPPPSELPEPVWLPPAP